MTVKSHRVNRQNIKYRLVFHIISRFGVKAKALSPPSSFIPHPPSFPKRFFTKLSGT